MSELIVEVCKVETIEKHPNADRLDIVTIKGWKCIVGKDEYKKGDLVVYIPPDSIMPKNLIEKYNLEFIKLTGRVKTIKLRQHISQGLVLPNEDNDALGTDVAKKLGITKYSPPEPEYQNNGKIVTRKKSNPYFDRYTDIQNIKHYNKLFKRGDEVVITEKIHGTNFRAGILPIHDKYKNPIKTLIAKIKKYIFKKTHEFVYGSHNVQITNNTRKNFYGDDIYGLIAKRYELKERLERIMNKFDVKVDSIILYGEIYGKGVQDLEYGLEEKDLVVFDVKVNGVFERWKTVKIVANELGIKTVPELFVGKYTDMRLVNKNTKGTSSLAPNQIKEGCVIKMVKEENDSRLGRKILKSINEEYLLRKNATEFK